LIDSKAARVDLLLVDISSLLVKDLTERNPEAGTLYMTDYAADESLSSGKAACVAKGKVNSVLCCRPDWIFIQGGRHAH